MLIPRTLHPRASRGRRVARLLAVAVLALAIGPGCSRSQPAPARLGGAPPGPAVATFTGIADPALGTITIVPDPPSTPGGLTVWTEHQDGTAGSGPQDTLELVTVSSAPYPGVEAGGCGGGVDAFRGDVLIRSFFRNQTLENVYAEITEVTGGFAGCVSAAAVPGASAASGLWSYGSIAPGASQTATWRFRFQTSQRFTFRGRILADLGPPAHIAGAPEFDWTPSAVLARRSFRRVGTTVAHLVWDGSTFVNDTGGITFTSGGTPGSTFSLVPGAPYANGTGYFVATEANGGNPADLSGNFTACVKFKPGTHPAWGSEKVLLAKGDPSSGDGWALMQGSGTYAIHYRVGASTGESYLWKNSLSVETFAYDHVCGGRSGNDLHVQAHGTAGDSGSWGGAASGTFTGNGAALPLAIGAYPGGAAPASDAGVYEVILDSRAPTPAVMQEIVNAAEGRTVPDSPAQYVWPSTSAAAYVALDGVTYTLPPYATPLVAQDGTGLLDAGGVVKYLHPLAENTAASGYCAGVVVEATGDWGSVGGAVLGFDRGYASPVNWDWDCMWMTLNPFVFHSASGSLTASTWPTGSGGAHTFVACVTSGNAVKIYLDGAEVGSDTVAGSAVDLSITSPERKLHIGDGNDTALTGARVRRAFLCPTSVVADCQ